MPVNMAWVFLPTMPDSLITEVNEALIELQAENWYSILDNKWMHPQVQSCPNKDLSPQIIQLTVQDLGALWIVLAACIVAGLLLNVLYIGGLRLLALWQGQHHHTHTAKWPSQKGFRAWDVGNKAGALVAAVSGAAWRLQPHELLRTVSWSSSPSKSGYDNNNADFCEVGAQAVEGLDPDAVAAGYDVGHAPRPLASNVFRSTAGRGAAELAGRAVEAGEVGSGGNTVGMQGLVAELRQLGRMHEQRLAQLVRLLQKEQ